MRPLRAAAVGATLLVAMGCAPDALPTVPGPRPVELPMPLPTGELPPPDPVTREQLERAADGLVYSSESDYPFEYFFQPAGVHGSLTLRRFRAALRIPSYTPVEQRSLAEFLGRHIDRVDPGDSAAVALIPRYERLRDTLRTTLRDVRVFRVGRILIRCYLVGIDPSGNIVGLSTWAVET